MGEEIQKFDPAEEKNMTIADLIVALQALPPEQQRMIVMTEGCDCFGHVTAVGTATSFGIGELDDTGEVVVLRRPKGD